MSKISMPIVRSLTRAAVILHVFGIADWVVAEVIVRLKSDYFEIRLEQGI